jgi:hypothetical protein
MTPNRQSRILDWVRLQEDSQLSERFSDGGEGRIELWYSKKLTTGFHTSHLLGHPCQEDGGHSNRMTNASLGNKGMPMHFLFPFNFICILEIERENQLRRNALEIFHDNDAVLTAKIFDYLLEPVSMSVMKHPHLTYKASLFNLSIRISWLSVRVRYISLQLF